MSPAHASTPPDPVIDGAREVTDHFAVVAHRFREVDGPFPRGCPTASVRSENHSGEVANRIREVIRPFPRGDPIASVRSENHPREVANRIREVVRPSPRGDRPQV